MQIDALVALRALHSFATCCRCFIRSNMFHDVVETLGILSANLTPRSQSQGRFSIGNVIHYSFPRYLLAH